MKRNEIIKIGISSEEIEEVFEVIVEASKKSSSFTINRTFPNMDGVIPDLVVKLAFSRDSAIYCENVGYYINVDNYLSIHLDEPIARLIKNYRKSKTRNKNINIIIDGSK